MEFYGNYENVESYFLNYIKNCRELVAACIDDENFKDLYDKLDKKDRQKIITYGFSDNADVSAKITQKDNSGIKIDLTINNKLVAKGCKLQCFGDHNVLNSLAIVAVGNYLKIDNKIIIKALASFEGVKRRFTKVGNFNGAVVIDDYAHHPTEIKACLNAASAINKVENKIIAVFQPHKYTRVNDLMDDFAASLKLADLVILDHIFSANQSPIEGVNQDILAQKIEKMSDVEVVKLQNHQDLPDILNKMSKKDDIILFMGAGDITNLAYNIAN